MLAPPQGLWRLAGTNRVAGMQRLAPLPLRPKPPATGEPCSNTLFAPASSVLPSPQEHFGPVDEGRVRQAPGQRPAVRS
jgi:hypothetical protein